MTGLDLWWDARWTGDHGIGRFQREIRARLTLPVRDIRRGPRPGTPLDALWLGCRLGHAGLRVSPGFNAAVPRRGRQLLTVHDLIHLRHPGEASLLKRRYYTDVLRPAIDETGVVMTVSAFTQREIVDWLGLSPGDVVVVGNGVSPAFLQDPGVEVEREAPFVLFVGNEKPHKRFDLLLASMRVLPGYRLAVVGLPASAVEAACSRTGFPSTRVDLHRAVPDQDLARLYARAACTAIPSDYEGFGLPAVEAAAVGCPVAYRCDAVDEVVAGLGARAEREGPEGFAEAIERAVAARGQLGEQLRRRARTYTWESAAAAVEAAVARANARI